MTNLLIGLMEYGKGRNIRRLYIVANVDPPSPSPSPHPHNQFGGGVLTQLAVGKLGHPYMGSVWQLRGVFSITPLAGGKGALFIGVV